MSLFLDHRDVQNVREGVERVRVLVRKAKRYTTKAESRTGQEAHRALHDAEQELDKLLKRL